jgi:DNA-directed RNA polymerase subunit RPC12/RpoP
MMKYCVKCGKEVKEDMNFCPSCGASQKNVTREEYTVSSDDLMKRIKELIHEGNVTRIIVKNEKGETLLEIPATVGFIGTILAPWAAALGVIAAIATKCRIIVERRET